MPYKSRMDYASQWVYPDSKPALCEGSIMSKALGKFLFCSFTLLVTAAAQAIPINYDESVDGDLTVPSHSYWTWVPIQSLAVIR